MDLDESEAMNKIMRDFDTTRDSRLELHEFEEGITRWLNKAVHSGKSVRKFGTMKFLDDARHVRQAIFYS